MKNQCLTCPSCGSKLSTVDNPEWLMTTFSGHFARILAALLNARRNLEALTVDELIDYVYYESRQDRTKIPADALNSVNATISTHQKALVETGWKIISHRMNGMRMYQLIRLDIANEETNY